jgi:hypothetical protein
MDKLEHDGKALVPRDTPYGLRVESDEHVIVQHSRLDARGVGLSYLSVMGFPASDLR